MQDFPRLPKDGGDTCPPRCRAQGFAAPVFGGANWGSNIDFVYYSHTFSHCQPNRRGLFLGSLHKYRGAFAYKASAETAKIGTGTFYDVGGKMRRFFHKLPQENGKESPILAEIRVINASNSQ